MSKKTYFVAAEVGFTDEALHFQTKAGAETYIEELINDGTSTENIGVFIAEEIKWDKIIKSSVTIEGPADE